LLIDNFSAYLSSLDPKDTLLVISGLPVIGLSLTRIMEKLESQGGESTYSNFNSSITLVLLYFYILTYTSRHGEILSEFTAKKTLLLLLNQALWKDW
jgi:hypothetical protein